MSNWLLILNKLILNKLVEYEVDFVLPVIIVFCSNLWANSPEALNQGAVYTHSLHSLFGGISDTILVSSTCNIEPIHSNMYMCTCRSTYMYMYM